MTTNLQREKLSCGCIKGKCSCDPMRVHPPVCCKDCPTTSPTDTTVEKWDMAARPDTTIITITDSIFNAIAWEKHYTVKERQALNDVVDEIVSHSLQQAREERDREWREKIIEERMRIAKICISISEMTDEQIEYLENRFHFKLGSDLLTQEIKL